MRKLFFFVSLLVGTIAHAQQVGIGTGTPAPSAMVEVSSTDKGFLPPRMTFAQREAIHKPAKGLMIYCTDCDELQVYNGFMWTNMSGASASIKALPGVLICYHTWMYKNAAVRTYRNGDTIPVVTDPVAWANLTSGAMCWYNNDSAANDNSYGALYNWYALADPRGLAPTGWHIPTNVEWNILTNCLGGETFAGGKMKEVSLLWSAPNTGASNSSGFTAYPGGYRKPDGQFSDAGNAGYWWSSTASGTSTAKGRSLVATTAQLLTTDHPKTAGFSLRFVRN